MKENVPDILSEAKQLYEAKNDDYGDSWRLTGKTIELWLDHQGIEVLEIPAESEYLNAFGLFFRRADKDIRSFNGTFLKDEMEVDENVPETLKDQVPYSAMHTLLARQMS